MIAGAIFVVPSLPREWLAGGPFIDCAIPALALGVLCGGGSLIAAALVVWRPALGGVASVAAGRVMAIFELVEVAAVGFMVVKLPAEPASYLQPFYFMVGVVTAALGTLVWRDADASERTPGGEPSAVRSGYGTSAPELPRRRELALTGRRHHRSDG